MKLAGLYGLVILLILWYQIPCAQEISRSRGILIEKKNEFYDSLTASCDDFLKIKEKPEVSFKMDFTGMDLPKSVSEFNSYWHQQPVSQGISGMCWCFSTTSFFESEIYRITNRQIKLSELYTVYWEYVEKARRFIQERGDSEFEEGSEANAVPRIWRKYGTVPAEAYTGLKNGQIFHDHRALIKEMKEYLAYVKTNNLWNEDITLNTIRSILDHHLGSPPQMVEVDGKKMSAMDYLRRIVKLNLDNYINFMSLLEQPYYQKVEYAVPDNWWHSREYHNIPLNEFMGVLKKAVRDGYTLCIGGDTSEPGYDSHAEVAMIPTFDIPANYIDEDARQFRFSYGSTTDDHGIHIVGYLEKNGKDWYLIKDSGSGSRNGENFGYYFYHEDYIKLKIMDIMVHRDAAEEILSRFQNE